RRNADSLLRLLPPGQQNLSHARHRSVGVAVAGALHRHGLAGVADELDLHVSNLGAEAIHAARAGTRCRAAAHHVDLFPRIVASALGCGAGHAGLLARDHDASLALRGRAGAAVGDAPADFAAVCRADIEPPAGGATRAVAGAADQYLAGDGL